MKILLLSVSESGGIYIKGKSSLWCHVKEESKIAFSTCGNIFSRGKLAVEQLVLLSKVI